MLSFFLFSFFYSTYSQEMKVEYKNPFGFIKFESKNESRIFLRASYRGEPFEMIIDSYAFFSSLPEEWAVKKWGFKKTPYINTTTDINNKRTKAKLRLMDTLEVANNFLATQFYINPKKEFNRYQIGILATDFLNDLNWKIDFRNGVLFFDTASYDLTSIQIKNEFNKNAFPYLTAKIVDIEAKLVVDLGAKEEISIPADSELGKRLISFHNLSPAKVISSGANSYRKVDYQYRVLLDSIYIENQIIRNVNVRLSTNTKVSYIGCNLLKRGTLYLNYLNRGKSNSQVGFDIKN